MLIIITAGQNTGCLELDTEQLLLLAKESHQILPNICAMNLEAPAELLHGGTSWALLEISYKIRLSIII